MATLQQQLDEAIAARHALAIGKSVAQVRDSNGETITYTAANLTQLTAYIADLQRQIGGGLGPLRVLM